MQLYEPGPETHTGGPVVIIEEKISHSNQRPKAASHTSLHEAICNLGHLQMATDPIHWRPWGLNLSDASASRGIIWATAGGCSSVKIDRNPQKAETPKYRPRKPPKKRPGSCTAGLVTVERGVASQMPPSPCRRSVGSPKMTENLLLGVFFVVPVRSLSKRLNPSFPVLEQGGGCSKVKCHPQGGGAVKCNSDLKHDCGRSGRRKMMRCLSGATSCHWGKSKFTAAPENKQK